MFFELFEITYKVAPVSSTYNIGPLTNTIPGEAVVIFSVIMLFIMYVIIKGIFVFSPKRNKRYDDGSVERDLYQKLYKYSRTKRFSRTNLLSASKIRSIGFRTFFDSHERNRYNTFYVGEERNPSGIAVWEYYKIWTYFNGMIMCLLDKKRLRCDVKKLSMKITLGSHQIGLANFKSKTVDCFGFPSMTVDWPKGFKVTGAKDTFWYVLIDGKKVARIMCWSKNLLTAPDSEDFVEFFGDLHKDQKAVIIGIALFVRLRKYIMALDIRLSRINRRR